MNLLVALDELLHAPTMRVAADRLGLTQPALSNALKRLREHYGDQLIIYGKHGANLTPLAQTLGPVVRDLLMTARGTTKLKSSFDPAKHAGSVIIACTEWIELTILKRLLAIMAREAPRIEIAIWSQPPQPAEDLFARGVDLVFTADAFIAPLKPIEHLLNEDYVCIAWSGNRHVAKRLDRETFASCAHLGVLRHTDGSSPQFEEMDADRSIRIRVSGHAALPHFLVGGEMLAVTTRRYAAAVAKVWPIKVLELPYDIPPLRISIQWQPWRHHDLLINWLRSKLRASVEETGSQSQIAR